MTNLYFAERFGGVSLCEIRMAPRQYCEMEVVQDLADKVADLETFGMHWVKCPEMPPETDENGETCEVIAHFGPGAIDEGLCQNLNCNATWFRKYWQQQGFTHWALITTPKN